MPRGKKLGKRSWHGELQGRGYRITAGRKAILDVLMEDPQQHLSAEDIYLKVHTSHPGIGLTTIYRTLEIFVNMGLIVKFDFGDGRARYEILEETDSENHHHHLVCTQCKRIINYNDFIDEEIELLKKTEKGLSKKYNFDIKMHIIQFYGICKNCKKTG